jgi:hypothetical protein
MPMFLREPGTDLFPRMNDKDINEKRRLEDSGINRSAILNEIN